MPDGSACGYSTIRLWLYPTACVVVSACWFARVHRFKELQEKGADSSQTSEAAALVVTAKQPTSQSTREKAKAMADHPAELVRANADAVVALIVVAFILMLCVTSSQPSDAFLPGAFLIILGVIALAYGYKLWYYTVFTLGFILGAMCGGLSGFESYLDHTGHNILDQTNTCEGECYTYVLGRAIPAGIVFGLVMLVL